MQLILKKLLDKKKAVKQIKSAVHYLPTNFDFNIPNVNPTNIKIAILDTGVPGHTDMANIGSKTEVTCVDLLASKTSVWDEHGHATLVTGILASSNIAYFTIWSAMNTRLASMRPCRRNLELEFMLNPLRLQGGGPCEAWWRGM